MMKLSRSFLRVSARGLGARSFALALLCVGLFLSCDSPQPVALGPLVRLNLQGLDPAATRVDIQVTAQDLNNMPATRTQEWNSSGPYDTIGVTFPLGTRGMATFKVAVFKNMSCLLGEGNATVTLSADNQVEVTLQLTPPAMTCGIPTPNLSTQVITGVGGAGLITSNPAGINCAVAGASCSMKYMQGMQVTLHAAPSQGIFSGWSGGGCSGTGDCTLTLTQDTLVQAIFKKSGCTGWCAETPPSTSKTLYGIAGTAPNNVVAVGQSGTIFKWDGTAWTTQSSGISADLFAATVPIGDTTIIAVGDQGYVLFQSQGSQVWSRIANIAGGPKLYGVSGDKPSEVFIVGEKGTYLKGNTQAGFVQINQASIGTRTLTAISARADGEHYLVATGGFAYRRFLVGATETYADQTTGTSFDLAGVWTGSNVVFGVGLFGTLIRRMPGGSTMASDNMWSNGASGSGQNLNAVWGSADNSVYIGGNMGTILRYDGTLWNKETTPSTQNLWAVWGTGPNNVYAVGDNGTILHYLP